MTAYSYEHPVGDLEPNFRLELRQPAAFANGVAEAGARQEPDGSWTKPIDLTTAISVTIRLYLLGQDSAADFSRTAIITGDPTLGVVELVWQSGDPVEQLGAYRVTARILWGNSRPQTVPSRREDPLTLRVVEQAPF